MFAEKLLVVINLIISSVNFGTPLLLGTTGEILTEKSGSLNLGVEGTMAVGAIGGYLMACYANSLLAGIVFAFVCAALCGLLFAFITVTLKANQNVTGLTMTIFGVGLYQFVGQTLKSNGKYPIASNELISAVSENGIPLLKDIPFVGPLLFGYNSLVYLAIFVAVGVWFYIQHTKKGLQLRAIGENPASADSVGVNVNRVKYINNIIGSGIMGIGGLYMALVINKGAWNDNWVNGYGWIAIALVVFASWSPAKALGGSLLFGMMLALQSKIAIIAETFPAVLGWTIAIPIEFYQMLPFLCTAVILVLSSVRKKKGGVQPAYCGINYFREDR